MKSLKILDIVIYENETAEEIEKKLKKYTIEYGEVEGVGAFTIHKGNDYYALVFNGNNKKSTLNSVFNKNFNKNWLETDGNNKKWIYFE